MSHFELRIVVTEGVETENDTAAFVTDFTGSKRHKIVKATSLHSIPLQFLYCPLNHQIGSHKLGQSGTPTHIVCVPIITFLL